MRVLFALWMLSSNPVGADDDVVSTRSRQLSQAVDALHGGDGAGSMSILLALHEADPADDDVAYWLAYQHYAAGRGDEALAVLSDRQGTNLPACRFRVLEARTLAILGQRERALELMKSCQDSPDPDEPLLAALMGLLYLEQGNEPEGIEWIRRSGGNPWAVMDEPLRLGIPEALNTRVMNVLEPFDTFISVVVDAMPWRVDLRTGLAMKSKPTAPEAIQGAFDVAGVQRTEMVPCEDGHAWSSPSEPLSDGRAGVFKTVGGSVVRVASSPAIGVDDRPSCAGEVVWFVRRIEGQSALIAIREGPDWTWSPDKGSLASVDARLGPGGKTELLLGWVIDGDIGVWATPAEPFEPVKVLSGEALAPRWVP